MTWRVGPNVPRLASIWAEDENGVIGDGKGMLWLVPADSRHFRQSTLGCPVVMGRASYEALGKPLPDRTNIVITRKDLKWPNVTTAHSFDEALEEGVKVARQTDADTVWVAGGGMVYEEAMSYVDELVVTYLRFPADCPGRYVEGGNLVYAPHVNQAEWRVDPERSDTEWREQSGDAEWKVVTYVRA